MRTKDRVELHFLEQCGEREFIQMNEDSDSGDFVLQMMHGRADIQFSYYAKMDY